MKKFLKVFSYCIGFTFLIDVLQIICGIFFTFAYIILFMGPGLLSSGPADLEAIISIALNNVLLPSMIAADILAFFIAWLLHIIFRRKYLERLSFTKVPLLLIGLCFLIGLALQLPVGHLLDLVENTGIVPDMFQEYAELMEPLMSDQSLILQILTIGILGPALEEIMFRGLIFHQLRRNIPVILALFLQAFLFGLAHLNVVQGTYAFLTGLLLGLAVLWSGSLLLPVLMHVGMNLSGVLLSSFGDGLSDSAYNLMTIISYILIPACMLLLYWLTQKKKNRQEELPANV